MKLESERKTVKAISKYRYEVVLMKDSRDVYYISAFNKITNKTKNASILDYGMANSIFDAYINTLEGN